VSGRSACLREETELAESADRLFAIAWRLDEFLLTRAAIDFRDFASRASFGPLSLAGVPLVDGDLAVAGAGIADAAPDEVRSCMSVVAERHRAINWLIGDAELYSEVRTDT